MIQREERGWEIKEREEREMEREKAHSATLKCRLSGTITDEISEHSM